MSEPEGCITLRSRKINKIVSTPTIKSAILESEQNKIERDVLNSFSDPCNSALLPYYNFTFPLLLDKNLILQNSFAEKPPCAKNLIFQNSLTENHSKVKPSKMDFNFDRAFKLIPEYDGSPSTLHRFLHCCNIVVQSINDGDDMNTFMELAQVKLVGKAYNETVLTNTYNTWKELESDLKIKFSDVRPLVHIQVELVKARQQYNEDVKQYGSRIEQLLSDLNKSCNMDEHTKLDQNVQTINSRTALRAFEDGLRDPLRILIKACRFDNLKDAISKAIEEENISKSSVSSNSYAGTSYKNQYRSNPTFHKAPNLNFNRQIRNNSNNNFTNSSTYQTPTSSRQYSHQPDHNRNTFRPRIDQVLTQPCAYCKKFGHHIRECWSREKSNQRQNTNLKNSTPENSENSHVLEQKPKDAAVRVQDL